MKRTWLIAFVLTYLLGLVGCDPGTNRLDGEEILPNTVKIELVQYENTTPKLIRIRGRKKSIYNFSNATVIATLDDSYIDDVVKEIANNEMLVNGRTLNEPIGKTMILHQSDGSMIVLFGCVYRNGNTLPKYFGMCNVYDENGMFVEYLGDISSTYVDALEAKYFVSDS